MDAYLLSTVAICLLAAVVTIVYVVVSAALTAKIIGGAEKARILNTFPGELTQGNTVQRIVISILAGASALLALAGYLMLWGGLISPVNSSSPSPSSIFLLIFSLVAVVSLGVSSFMPLSNIRGSLILWGLGIFFTVGVGIFSMMVGDGPRKLLSMNQICTYVAAGISVILLLSLLNPRIKDWAKMEKGEVDGTTYWIRPRVNFMALDVWATYLVQAVLMIIFAVGILLGQPATA